MAYHTSSSACTATHGKCYKCLEWKLLTLFPKSKLYASGRGAICNVCRIKHYTFPAALKKYGLTVGQYQEMTDSQGGKCLICNHEPTGKHRGDYLNVDHCHAGGSVRGLLCMGCNIALGHFRDDVDLLSKAIEYLKRPHVVFPAHLNATGSRGTGSRKSTALYQYYRIRLDGFEWMVEQQGNVCLICSHPTPKSVDHDHSCCPGKKACGKCIRGVLCRKCNAGLGNAKDDAKTLGMMREYLESKQ